ncbi:MAG: Crp/Fnr family transcriptional regulator [Clostridiales bacterium]|nr:Crp/Fnr family transcriptional regulator [Clostridiales bacterium]
MERHLPLLKETRLFSGVEETDLRAMLSCLDAKERSFVKGQYIVHQGEQLSEIMILAEGSAQIQRDDYWGNRSIIALVGPGDMFGESYAAPGSAPMANDVIALSPCTVLYFNVQRILTVCSTACRFHSMVVQNLFYAISDANRRLVQKLDHMTKRTTREKLLSYLSQEAARQKSSSFTIPFNRQQLADYLSVDRSAMSSELGKMRTEGLITYEKSRFTLL